MENNIKIYLKEIDMDGMDFMNLAHDRVLWYTVDDIVIHLAFGGPYIVIYSYNRSQQDALFLNFILIYNSTSTDQYPTINTTTPVPSQPR